MVLKVLADTRQGVNDVDAKIAQGTRGTYAGGLQDLRRADHAGRNDQLAPGPELLDLTAPLDLDAAGAFAFHQDAPHHAICHQREIGSLQRRGEIGSGGARPEPAAPRLLVIADALVGPAVDVLAEGEADFVRGRDDRAADLRRLGKLGNHQRPIGPPRVVTGGLTTPALRLIEIRAHVLVGPAAIAELRPVIVIVGLAANIEQAVDRARSAEALAAREEDRAPARLRLRLGSIAPGYFRVVEKAQEAGRNVDQRMGVTSAGLDEQDAHRRILA